VVWNLPGYHALNKVLHEIIARCDGEIISLTLHWQGGDHTAMQFTKSKTGEHRWAAPQDLVALVCELARQQSDQGITAILNRLGKRTAKGHTWTETRVRTFRNDHQIAAYREGERAERGELTLAEAAQTLAVSTMTIRRLIERKLLPARQACPGSPQ
jgi:excisionase family DNA binding protein